MKTELVNSWMTQTCQVKKHNSKSLSQYNKEVFLNIIKQLSVILVYYIQVVSLRQNIHQRCLEVVETFQSDAIQEVIRNKVWKRHSSRGM